MERKVKTAEGMVGIDISLSVEEARMLKQYADKVLASVMKTVEDGTNPKRAMGRSLYKEDLSDAALKLIWFVGFITQEATTPDEVDKALFNDLYNSAIYTAHEIKE